ncbi:hypothetical protein B0H13DRAFT_2301048 [Mycena leptocephala]|nr:hypothetical protein B0H13DRAFT_2301048 [Mycena leptocephala]
MSESDSESSRASPSCCSPSLGGSGVAAAFSVGLIWRFDRPDAKDSLVVAWQASACAPRLSPKLFDISSSPSSCAHVVPATLRRTHDVRIPEPPTRGLVDGAVLTPPNEILQGISHHLFEVGLATPQLWRAIELSRLHSVQQQRHILDLWQPMVSRSDFRAWYNIDCASLTAPSSSPRRLAGEDLSDPRLGPRSVASPLQIVFTLRLFDGQRSTCCPWGVIRSQTMFIMFALGNQLKQLDDSKPSFEVSADLIMNICKYAPAVLLSSKINVYTEDTATNILMSILKKYRFDFDISSDIENIPADWAKLVTEAQDALTQRRSMMKKKAEHLKVNKNDKSFALEADHQNIFQLAEATVKKTLCSVDIVLCTRVALMRKVYLKHPGTDFWDKLDLRLAKIRKEADGDPKKITKAFRHILEEDKKLHGKNDVVLDETAVDEFQQGVDDLIDIGVIDAATSVETDDS